MAYNRDLFREAGLAEPPAKYGDPAWGADAWLRALQRTTRADATGQVAAYGITDPGASFAIQYRTGMWKAAWLADDMQTITSDSAAMIESTDYPANLITRQRVMARGAQIQDAFGTTPEQAFLTGRRGIRDGGQMSNLRSAVRRGPIRRDAGCESSAGRLPA